MLIQLNALHILVNTDAASASFDLETLRDGLKTLEQMTREVLDTVRTAIEDLPLPELEGVTLSEALSQLVEETAERLGISSRISFSGVDEQEQSEEHSLSCLAERLLFLVAREALYQVEQHQGARRLRLSLNYGQDEIQMSIEDDGVNAGVQVVESVAPGEVAPDRLAPPFGKPSSATEVQVAASIINDLRYRIEHLGGTLEISASREQGKQGTRVLARLPYSHSKAETDVVPATISETPSISASSSTVRLLIVDNQAVTRAGLIHLLESYPDLQVVGQAADGVQAVSETLELGPQVVLMDAQLPAGQSLEALRQIKQLNPDTAVLLLSAQDREDYLYETLRAGANGYVLKDIAPEELAQAIHAVARGEVLVQPQLAGKLLSRFGREGRPPYETLTARELEVLRLLAQGLRNKEIAARLYVSERTVSFHLANIYQKLAVSGRTEALRKALDQGLI